MDIKKTLDALRSIEEGAKFHFAGEKRGQKPGDQVRGNEKATTKKSGQHPFAGRLVGASESKSILADLEKQIIKGDVERRLIEEYAQFNEAENEFVLYINGRPVAKYSNIADARRQRDQLLQKFPNEDIQLKQEFCDLIDIEEDSNMLPGLDSDSPIHGESEINELNLFKKKPKPTPVKDPDDYRTLFNKDPVSFNSHHPLDVKHYHNSRDYYEKTGINPLDAKRPVKELAPPSGNNGDDEMAILKYYAGLWWNGNDATRQYVEKTLAKMGWEIGEDEGGYKNGGVFVVQPGDENGKSYESWPAEELTEGVAEADDDMFSSQDTTTGKYWRGGGDSEYQQLWNQLVPVSGVAPTVEGELLRAASRLYYDWYNNGFGNNTSGAANFIKNYGDYYTVARAIQTIEPYLRGNNSDADSQSKSIERALEVIVDSVVAQIKQANGNYHPNTTDLFDLQDPDDPYEEPDDDWYAQDEEYDDEDDDIDENDDMFASSHRVGRDIEEFNHPLKDIGNCDKSDYDMLINEIEYTINVIDNDEDLSTVIDELEYRLDTALVSFLDSVLAGAIAVASDKFNNSLVKALRNGEEVYGTEPRPAVHAAVDSLARGWKAVRARQDRELEETRIVNPENFDIHYKPGHKQTRSQLIARSIPHNKVDAYIETLCDKFGVKPGDFELTPNGESQVKIDEYGMTTGGTVQPTGMNNATNQPAEQNPADAAKQLTTTQSNINKLKAAGVNIPTGVGQAAKAAVTTANDTTGNPVQHMDPTGKKIMGSLGQELEKLLATGNPSQVQQVAAAIKQSKMSQGQQ